MITDDHNHDGVGGDGHDGDDHDGAVVDLLFLSWDTNWPHGLTVSTLDSECSDRDSNRRETFADCIG